MLHKLDNRLIYKGRKLALVMKIFIKCAQYPNYPAHILYQYVIACDHYLLLGDRFLYHRLLHHGVIFFDRQDSGLKLLC
jgi:hypothetical protein